MKNPIQAEVERLRADSERTTTAGRLIHAAIPRFHDYAQIDDLAREIVAEVERLRADYDGLAKQNALILAENWRFRVSAEQAEAKLAKMVEAATAFLREIGHEHGDPCDVGEGCKLCALSAAAQPEEQKS